MFTKYYEIVFLPRELGLNRDCCFSSQMKMGDIWLILLKSSVVVNITFRFTFITDTMLHLYNKSTSTFLHGSLSGCSR